MKCEYVYMIIKPYSVGYFRISAILHTMTIK
nr:MAG TPA: hypothetical protein [Caudoviricetes sp.]